MTIPAEESRRHSDLGAWALAEYELAAAEQLQARLPERVFDAHAHIYRLADLPSPPPLVAGGPLQVHLDHWRVAVGEQVGAKRLEGALLLPYPVKGLDVAAANRFVLAEAAGDPRCRAALVVTPQSQPSEFEDLVNLPQVAGFKPYHIFSTHEPTFDSSISQFVPEWAWQLAHTYGKIIVLHMVKDRALADPVNQQEIIDHCRRYPGARLVLAHAARGFHAPNTLQGIDSLVDFQNVWFDTSGVCEPEAIVAILDRFGPRRVMWGSDFPVSQLRGRCVTIGTGFAWVTDDHVAWNSQFFGRPLAVGLESLRAALGAADQLGLDRDDLRDIFCDNARRLLGIDPAPAEPLLDPSRPDETAAAEGRAGQGASITQSLYRHAKVRIPGGTQLLSKRPEMFVPDQWPAYFREARGCEIWDLDGRHYYDFGIHGIGACPLGFRDPDVTRAVRRRLELGSFCTLNPAEEVQLADRLCGLHPWAHQARFTRSGGEAMAVAVRIARATTDRSVVAVCGYHGWHDWYLAANLGDEDALRGHLLPGLDPKGVPRELRGTAFTFTYNRREELERIVQGHGSRLAAVVMEPCRYHDPEPGFLEFARDVAHAAGALLVFDEITIGWRLALGGAHLKFGVDPDLAVFAKGLGNGHPIGAVLGTREAMRGAHESFISSTYWTDGLGPAAALATIDKLAAANLPAHAEQIGNLVKEAWRQAGRRHGVPVTVDDGYPALAHFSFQHEEAQVLKTLYIQQMLQRGILAAHAIYVSMAHTAERIDIYLRAIDEVFAELGDALRLGDVEKRLRGPVAHSGFRRLL
ncbi:MAG: aminotransferase class III-fold pyridoxal phosphate-dependent enzyme [Thermoguttaceae bacterium]